MINHKWMRFHASLMAITVAAASQMAYAQSDSTADRAADKAAQKAADRAADAVPNTADIVVTGTKIKGVAPIGSNLVSVGRDIIEKTAPVNVSQLVNTVPSISTAGSASQGENAYSYYSPQIHSLAGSSSNTTLVIVDGLRLPGGGTQFAQTDPNIIPVSAIQRVEVLADGASSVYGSDAVAGVVNFITRKTFDGFEANFQGGVGDHYDNKNFSFIWGKKWSTGGVYLAGSWSQQSNLLNKDRSFSSMGDYTSIGGTNTNSYQCPAATMSVPGVSGVYLGSRATTTVANSQANSPCNNSVYATLLPSQGRGNVMIKMVNDFSDKISVTYMLNYNRQKTNAPNAPGGLSSVTVYGPGSGKGGQINPFFQAPAGSPGATQESINWLALTPNGNYGNTESQEDSIYSTAVVDYKLTDSWTVTLSDAVGWNRSALNTINGFCSACALLAVNGTAQASGSTTATDIAGQNVVALNTPLTTANALDVWNSSGGATQTSAAVNRALYTNNSENTNYNTFNQLKLDAQGTLFKLPAGFIKIAVGGEYYWTNETQKITGSDGTGPTTTGSNFRAYNYSRDVKSVYGEAYIPIVSPDMDIPLMYKIDASISGRYDSYSDVGSTANPKFAANWEVIHGLKFRGNYSRSFVAPPIAVIGDPTQGYLYASGSIGPTGALNNVPISSFPGIVNVPGVTCNATTCNMAGTTQGLRRQLGGGFTNEVPQKGRSWSLGVDLTPHFLPGFTASATFFHTQFIGGVSSPSASAIENASGLRNLLTICPNGCTSDQINTFANLANGASISGAVPSQVYFLLDQSSRNALNLTIEGIDGQVNYTHDIDGFGRITLGTAFTYFTKFTQNFGGGADFSILNTSGYNTTFPSVQFKNRAQLGYAHRSGISADLFWNHVGSYRNWISTSVAPITVDSIGNPTGGGDIVKASNTFDLHVQYEFQKEGFLHGWQLYADAQNLFNANPPFYNGNTSGILGGAWGFNGFVSNPIGRLVSLGLRVRM